MTILRPNTILRARALTLRPLVRASPIRIQARFATQDYGSGKGDPAGEKPQEQTKNPMSHLEHPGPEAPNVGGGKSSSSTSSSPSSSASSNSKPKDSGSQSGIESGVEVNKKPAGEGKEKIKDDGKGGHSVDGVKTEGGGKKGARPKILDDAPPEKESESTRKHNEEMESRKDRPHEKVGSGGGRS